MPSRLKPIAFCGDSLNELRAFPEGARQEAGFQLYRVQRGLDPADWKPMATIGRGVREIRIRDEAGAYRVIYIATFTEAVYVLHAFQKKTQRTAKRDGDLAASRLRDLARRAR
jgi:phage-related protein